MSDADGRIEFVDDDRDDGADEDLPEPRTRSRSTRRLRLGMVIGAAVLVVALLVGHAVQHSSTKTPNPTSGTETLPSAAATLSVVPQPSDLAIDPSTGQKITGANPTGNPAACPGHQCYTSTTVPADLLEAVRAYSPTARIRAAETVRIVDKRDDDPLWFRDIVASDRGATLELRIRLATAKDEFDGGANDDGAHTVSYIEQRLGQYYVRAQVTDHSGADQRYDALSNLVADTGVLAVG